MMLLLADDDQNAAESLAELLRVLLPAPVEIVFACDGEQALAAATGPDIPDVVITDLEMPRMDGISAAVAIRHKLNGRTPPLIAVTGRAEMLERPTVRQAFDHALLKPVRIKELLAILAPD